MTTSCVLLKKMVDDTSESAGQAETITEALSVRQVLLIQPSSVEADCVFYLSCVLFWSKPGICSTELFG